jgi:hypothetical protein
VREGLAAYHKYFKFFRFRTPINVFQFAGVREAPFLDLWLVDAFKYIDFNYEILTKESCLVMYYTKGGLPLSELGKLPFNRYEMFVEEAIRIQEEINKKPKEGEE